MYGLLARRGFDPDTARAAVERAMSEYGKALDIARKIGYQLGESHQLIGLGRAILASGAPSIARHRFEKAMALEDPRTDYRAVLMLGIVLLHQRDSMASASFSKAAARCEIRLARTDGLFEPHYVLATALVGLAVCDPCWPDKSKQLELLAPALDEYQRALQICDAPGAVSEVLRDLDMIRAAGMAGLDPIFELLSRDRSGSPAGCTS